MIQSLYKALVNYKIPWVMTKEEKKKLSINLPFGESKNVYLADIHGMDADQTSKLRRLCFNKVFKFKL